MIRADQIPPNVARCMSRGDRAAYPAAQSNAQAGSSPRRRGELAEQRIFAGWLKLQAEAGRLVYIWHRTDRKSTASPGCPDFIIALAGGKTLWVEMKVEGNKPSEPQRRTLDLLAKLEHQVTVCSSCDAAIRLVRLHQSVLF